MLKLLQPRLRATLGDRVALGPGKAELLARIQETGSIAQAAKKMGMSYMRAWTLLRTLHSCFKKPLVAVARGGAAGGGATLTPTGKIVLALYQKMERDCHNAVLTSWKKLSTLLRE